jgi:hypothetical protein
MSHAHRHHSPHTPRLQVFGVDIDDGQTIIHHKVAVLVIAKPAIPTSSASAGYEQLFCSGMFNRTPPQHRRRYHSYLAIAKPAMPTSPASASYELFCSGMFNGTSTPPYLAISKPAKPTSPASASYELFCSGMFNGTSTPPQHRRRYHPSAGYGQLFCSGRTSTPPHRYHPYLANVVAQVEHPGVTPLHSCIKTKSTGPKTVKFADEKNKEDQPRLAIAKPAIPTSPRRPHPANVVTQVERPGVTLRSCIKTKSTGPKTVKFADEKNKENQLTSRIPRPSRMPSHSK